MEECEWKWNEPGDVPNQLRKKTYSFQRGSLTDPDHRPIDFHGKIYIAPLTTVGNLPFRRVCVEYGADITCCEMAMCGNLLRAQTSEWALLRRHPSEKCFGIQLAGAKLEELGDVCEVVSRELRADFVDLNAGCPIDVLDKMGAGAALLARPNKLKRLLQVMLDRCKLSVTVKLRTGDKVQNTHKLIPQIQVRMMDNYKDQALQGVQGNRVEAVVIHGRTKQGRYTKLADWE